MYWVNAKIMQILHIHFVEACAQVTKDNLPVQLMDYKQQLLMLFVLQDQFNLCNIFYEYGPLKFSMSKQDFRLTYFYRFKLGEGAVQTAHSINVVWDGGSIGECTVQRWFQKFSLGHFISQTRKVAAGLLLRRKKLDTWAPHELTRSQDHVCLEICNSLLFTTKMNCFLRKSLSVAGQG